LTFEEFWEAEARHIRGPTLLDRDQYRAAWEAGRRAEREDPAPRREPEDGPHSCGIRGGCMDLCERCYYRTVNAARWDGMAEAARIVRQVDLSWGPAEVQKIEQANLEQAAYEIEQAIAREKR